MRRRMAYWIAVITVVFLANSIFVLANDLVKEQQFNQLLSDANLEYLNIYGERGPTEFSEVDASFYKVLEISNDGVSKIKPLNETLKIFIPSRDQDNYEQSLSNFSIDTYSIKQFNALANFDLENYDLIIFTYNEDGPSYNNDFPETCVDLKNQNICKTIDDTTNYLNDIIDNKAQNLKSMIDNNKINVIFTSEVFVDLDNNFNTYFDNDKYLSNVDTVEQLLAIYLNVVTNDSKTKFTLISEPISYLNNQNYAYQNDSKISFDINLMNFDSGKLTLYIDYNHDSKFTNYDIAYQSNVSSDTFSFDINLPIKVSNIYNWKLVYENELGHQYSESNYLRVKGEKQTIRVLEVTDTFYGSKNYTLNNMLDSSYLNQDDYNIIVDTVDYVSFKSNCVSDPLSHLNILKDYDILFFGYDTAKYFSNFVFYSMEEFIDNGNDVIFTGNVTENNYNEEVYKKLLGLSDYQLGYENATDQSINQLTLANETYYSLYPFKVSANPTVNRVISNEWTLGLGADVVPLFNLDVSDKYDSSSHYYSFKNQNVYYFKMPYQPTKHLLLAEKEMVTNLIVNAYNDKGVQKERPIDTRFTLNPIKNDNILIDTNDLNFSFTPTMLDNNINYTYKIYVNDIYVEGKEIIDSNNIVDVSHYLSDELNTIDDYTITVEYYGGSQLLSVDSFTFTYSKIKPITAERIIDYVEYNNQMIIPMGEIIPIQYMIYFNEIKNNSNLFANQDSLQLTEIILSDEININGVIYKTDLNFEMNYSLIGKYFIPEENNKNYNLEVIANTEGEINLHPFTVSYHYQNITTDIEFSDDITLSAYKPITSINVDDVYFIDINEIFSLNDFNLSNLYNSFKSISVVLDNNNIISYQDNVITGENYGAQNITLRVEDVFGNIVEKDVTFIVGKPVNTINVDNYIKIMEGNEITINLITNPQEVINYLDISFDNNYLSVSQNNGQINLTGLQIGTTIISFSWYNSEGQLITEETTIEILPNEDSYSFVDKEITIYKNQMNNILINSIDNNYTFKVIDESIINLNGNQVNGINTGVTTIQLISNGIIYDTLTVNVLPIVENITFIEPNIIINKSDNYDLHNNILLDQSNYRGLIEINYYLVNGESKELITDGIFSGNTSGDFSISVEVIHYSEFDGTILNIVEGTFKVTVNDNNQLPPDYDPIKDNDDNKY